ncbi:MAG: 3-deoxy-D-manno-octulosonic acid transferase [Candidatus Omnitrophica bacterium]|nr:3-deoxy-D-manno-octulosonic acid transferase [Candidatus Omnitrophota bacterium]MBU4479506.1 3-deoxy-D-manno-octulosonic acid transferase [Candidatus Omnitrophota bacterium]MCG2702985.1 3-deoxy-D-manno-octulosonic acid transferase [Candidatus Omnitrophota bacterium]
MRFILDIIYLFAACAYLPSFVFKGKHRLGIRQRFGIYAPDIRIAFKANQPRLWLHAVSVGEIKAAAALIEALRSRFPGLRFVISTITPTGNTVARQLAAREDIVIYFPFDLSLVVKKAVSMINPAAVLIMETEIWPNFIHELSAQHIPVAIVNGRISDKAFPRYRRGKFIFQEALKNIGIFCMQTENDASRIIELGADKQKVHIAGNIKFDQVKPAAASLPLRLGLKAHERLLVAGSTHDNEEEMITRVFLKLKPKYSFLRLLLAPRHPHRAAAVEKMLKQNGLFVQLISRLAADEREIEKDAVFLLDVMGILNRVYRLADIVFIGGSLVRHGGQNPIEAAACGKPVVFGRYMYNFSKIAKMFLDNKAALSVSDEDGLFTALDELLRDPGKKKQLAQNAQRLVDKNKGSVQRIIELLEKKSFFAKYG